MTKAQRRSLARTETPFEPGELDNANQRALEIAHAQHEQADQRQRAAILRRLRRKPDVAKRLRKVATFIRQHPKSLDMELWGTVHGKGAWGSRSCGTTACIAGWYAFLSPGVTPVKSGNPWVRVKGKTKGKGRILEIGELLANDLGLPFRDNDETWNSIVQANTWPEPFYTRWYDANNRRQRAAVAADRILHLVQTGE